VHNLARFEETVLLSAGFEVTLATANCDRTYYGPFTGYWNLQCAIDVIDQRGLTFANSEQPERSEAWREATFDYIGDHLDRLPFVLGARWGRVTGLYRPVQQADLDVFPDTRERWVANGGLVVWYPLAGLAVAGTIVLRRARRIAYPLVVPFAIVLITVAVTFGQTRYRASAEATVCVLAAVALDAAWRTYQRVRDEPANRALTAADGAVAAPDRAAPTT
jgi:hypothetical protein